MVLSLAFGPQENEPRRGFHATLCPAWRDDGYPRFDFERFLVYRHQPFPFKKMIGGRLTGMDGDLSTGFQADDQGFELWCLNQELRFGSVCRKYGFGFDIWKVNIGHGLLIRRLMMRVYTHQPHSNLRFRKEEIAGGR